MADLMGVAQGLGASFTITLRDSSGNPFTGYTGSEGLTGTVRAGRDSTPIFSLSPAWLDASAGTISLAIAGSDTASVDPGRYLVQLALADGSADLYEGFLEVAYSAGSAAALPTYGAFADMLDRAPWIEKLQRPTDLAGFARQRHLARRWFEDLLHRHYRYSSNLSTDFAFVPGVSFGGWYGMTTFYRDGRRSKDLQDWLDADRLDVTSQVIEAVSCYAIALLCDRQVAPGKDDNGYASHARKWFKRAEDTALSITAEIDSDGDGTNDTTIRLGIADTLEG
jgi:hypothetical protein